ncbi:unnamed protein product, partial [Rotaria sordida]
HILPSSPIVEVASTLQPKHFSYLTNGPKYVPPCQSRFSSGTIDKIILREYNHIIQSFEKGLTKNCISASDQRAKDFFTGIDDLLRRLHTNTLSPKLLARAQYEHRIMKSTQRQIKKSNVIIRITDKSKVFHLGSVQDYHEKALQYMQDTNAYREITSSINPYQQHVQTVLALIDPMLKKGEINRELWKQYMRPNSVTTELAHLYFVPKPHKIGTPLRPIVSSIKAATTGVSHFLDILLRPLFNRVTKDTTFINGIDFVRQLERYRMNGQLLPMTLFVTFDVTNLYTMIPRDGAIFALQKFLRQYGENRRIHGMTIDIIIRLARLVLDTNCFVYEKKYYQQIRGGAMGSPFTMTLANIYMLEWEHSLNEHQKMQNELYGRMSTQPSQIGTAPTESITMETNNEGDFNQILTDELVILSQSSIQLNMTNMIPSQVPNIPNPTTTHQNLTDDEFRARRREARRRRRQRRAERRRQARASQQQQRNQQRQERPRLEGVKRHIHEIHDDIFKNTNQVEKRLIVDHRNNPNIESELTRKRPPSSLLKLNQCYFRNELERRKILLKFDANDHQLVNAFYELKPRKTEMHSAQVIWKAVHDEQQLHYEIEIFRKHLTEQSLLTYDTFQELPLPKIHSILVQLLFNQPWLSTIAQTTSISTFIHDLSLQAISMTEKIAINFMEKVIMEKEKLVHRGKKFNKPPCIDAILAAIGNRQTNMVRRVQYYIEQLS